MSCTSTYIVTVIFISHVLFRQVFLLNRRFQQHQQIIWQGRGGVQDRTIYEDSVFAKVCRNIPQATGIVVVVYASFVHCKQLTSSVCSSQVLKDSGMMEEREYETYRSLFSNMSNFM